MKSILITAITLLLSMQAFFVNAQIQPQFPELKVKEDYLKAEPMVVQVTEWLTETDLDLQLELRQRSNAFVVQWLMGTPTITMVLGKQMEILCSMNMDLLAIYMGNYASYCIVNKSYTGPEEPAKAGLRAMVKVYRKGILIEKQKELEKLCVAMDENKLDEYVAKYMKADSKDHQK